MSDDVLFSAPPLSETPCAKCGKPLVIRNGESFVASTDGKVWHYGCKPRTLTADRNIVQELCEALEALEPYLDAIICYASTMGEHEPNRIAANARRVLAKAKAGFNEGGAR